MTDLLDTFNIDLEGDGTHLDKEVEAMDIEMVNPTRKTKKKRKRRSSVPEVDDLRATALRYQQILGEETVTRLLEDCRNSVRKSFEDEKQEKLDSLPNDYKKRFGEIAFTRYQKDYLPVLILNPYDVPPGPVRHTWLDVHEKLREEGRMHDLLYVVYWYGTSDENQCYAHIKSKQLLPYDSNVKKYRKLPKGIEKKLEKGEELSKNQKEEVRKWQEVDEDLQKPPAERKRGVVNFPEVYELVAVNDIADEAEELIAQMQGEAGKKSGGPSEVTKQVNQSKKRKKTDKDKKASKKDTEERVRIEKPHVGVISEIEKPVDEVSSEGIGEEEMSSEEDEADDDYVDEKQAQERDDHAKVDKSRKPSKEKKGKGESKQESTMDEMETDSNKVKDDDRKAGSKSRKEKKNKEKKKGKENSVATDSDKQSQKKKKGDGKKARDAELKRFEQCRKDYYPLVKQLSAQVQNNELGKIITLLEKLHDVADDFSAPFIRVCGLPQLIKSIKPLVKGKEKQFKTWSDLRTKLQDVYNRRQGEVPEGFQAPPIEKASTKSEVSAKKEQMAREGSTPKNDHVSPRASDSKLKSESEVAKPALVTTAEQNGSIQKETKASATVSKPKPKPERKSFSLGKLMNQKPQENSVPIVSEKPKPKSPTLCLPSWLTGPCELSQPSGIRFIGCEFLKDVALHLPQGKVDTNSFALELENAIYCKWPEESTYWLKLHAICAAIVGKRELGGLSKLIANGSISSPRILVELDEKQLKESFEGGYVDL